MRKAISSGGGTTAFRGNERWRCWDAQKKYVLLPGCWLQLDANHFQLAKQPFVSSLASWNMALRWYLPITPWASYASFWVVAGSCIACLARFLWVMKLILFISTAGAWSKHLRWWRPSHTSMVFRPTFRPESGWYRWEIFGCMRYSRVTIWCSVICMWKDTMNLRNDVIFN